MEYNKKFKPIVSIFLSVEENSIFFLVLISLSYFTVPKNIRLNVTHYFTMKNLTKKNFNK